MKYQYNYSFLGKWMSMNRNISIDTILQAIGTTSNNSLRLWEKGRTPMPTTSIMRFCNTFQVPISAFFCDRERDMARVPPYVLPDDTDQFEPDGGYVTERQQGSRALFDPLDVNEISSKIPGLVTPAARADDETAEGAHKTHTADETDANALIALETRHCEQRDKLIDIINRQQEQIAELTRQLLSVRKNAANSTKYKMEEEKDKYGMAAEPTPRK